MRYVCVYCGSADGARNAHAETASALGAAIGRHELGLVYGGARAGLMGRLADSALANGAPVIGVMPRQLARYEVEHRSLTELQWADSMHDRKHRMAVLADAFIVLPGGFGTLDEALEIVNMKQLKAHAKPIVFVNVEGFYEHLFKLFDALTEHGFAYGAARDLCSVVPTAEAAVAALRAHWSEGAR